MSQADYLTVAEALRRILDQVAVLEAVRRPLLEAVGSVLAERVTAHDSLPPFANASMDGYAVRAADVATATPATPVILQVVGDTPAGLWPDFVVAEGCAARITTGAPLPPGADAVVPVEETNEPWRDPTRPLPAQIHIRRSAVQGAYIRHVGEDVQAGQVILEPGHILRPQDVGALASLGVSRVRVVRPARVALLATGDELLDIDEPLQPGKIRNSNSYALAAQTLACGAEPVQLGVAGDREADVRARLQAALEARVDLFVSSAGVSVGAYDVVRHVLETEGEMGFWRVRMRPGKPLAFGRYQGIPYLGLPGNPVSAMVGFERFVRPALLKMMGHTHLDRPHVTAVLQESLQSDGRESYLRAHVWRVGQEYYAVTTGEQGSHLLGSLVKANALLIVPEGVKNVPAGAHLSALMLEWPGNVF